VTRRNRMADQLPTAEQVRVLAEKVGGIDEWTDEERLVLGKVFSFGLIKFRRDLSPEDQSRFDAKMKALASDVEGFGATSLSDVPIEDVINMVIADCFVA
jgi:hypothetical protein